MMDMLVLDNISKTFNPGTVNEKKALEHVSLTLAAGDFATIVGSNGAGKSTLFNAIAGSFFVDSGAVVVHLHAGVPAGQAHRPALPGPPAGHRPPHDH